MLALINRFGLQGLTLALSTLVVAFTTGQAEQSLARYPEFGARVARLELLHDLARQFVSALDLENLMQTIFTRISPPPGVG